MNELISSNRQARSQPAAVIMPTQTAVPRSQAIVVKNINSAEPVRDALNFLIDSLDRERRSVAALSIEDSGGWPQGLFKIVNNKSGLRSFAKRRNPLGDAT